MNIEKRNVTRIRNNLDKVANFLKVHPKVSVVPTMLNNIAAEWLLPAEASANSPLIFYLHGGGYLIGSAATHRFFLSKIAHFFGAKILAINYRLAPEFTFPTAVDDAVASYVWSQSQCTNGSKIIMMGDSAGGGLALATTIALRDQNLTLPDAVVCFSPWLDLSLQSSAYTQDINNRDLLLTPSMLHYVASQYLKNADANNSLASPMYADLKDLPPILIQVGSDEIFYLDILRFVQHARMADNQIFLQVGQKMQHCWQLFFEIVPEANDAIEQVKQFLQQERVLEK